MALRFTNTINRKKELFHSLLPGKVSIYCCGVTVYDLCHLGHARSYLSWDVLRRYLIWQGYTVSFIQNFTDIDDKIINRAVRDRCSMDQVSERNIAEFHSDMDSLGILRPDKMPRATKCLDGIIDFIKELEIKGFAYNVDGNVYFSVLKKKDYGKLSGRNLLDQKINAEGRVDSAEESIKKNPFDFALWKKARDNEPSFASPWGLGRPGWHIECSAMVREELGDIIDIHLGGADLVFPHHENEIAQSECLTGKDLARYWLHNGMVNVQGQKMSKSLGNFTTIRGLLEKGISPMTLRLFVLQAHYRKPLDFTEAALEAASAGWKGLNAALSLGNYFQNAFSSDELLNLDNKAIDSNQESNSDTVSSYKSRFIEAMDDDLNTSSALSILFEIARPLRSMANRFERGDVKNLDFDEKFEVYKKWKSLKDLSEVLGFVVEGNKKALTLDDKFINKDSIEKAIQKRKEAKLNKDYESADRIREDLKSKGIELIDGANNKTDWIRS